MATLPEIQIGSVKVMRSHDYCHFEVCLSSSLATTPDTVDELRKAAARLVDKAVDQYKAAKKNAEQAERDESKLENLRWRHRDILAKPEAERSSEEKAVVKAIDDRAFRNRPRYDYEEDWIEPDYDDQDDEDGW